MGLLKYTFQDKFQLFNPFDTEMMQRCSENIFVFSYRFVLNTASKCFNTYDDVITDVATERISNYPIRSSQIQLDARVAFTRCIHFSDVPDKRSFYKYNTNINPLFFFWPTSSPSSLHDDLP